MIMVVHQTIGVAEPAIARDYLRKGFKKEFAIAIGEKDLLAGVILGS